MKVASSPGSLMDGLDGSNAILQQEQEQQSLNPKDWIAVGSFFYLFILVLCRAQLLLGFFVSPSTAKQDL